MSSSKITISPGDSENFCTDVIRNYNFCRTRLAMIIIKAKIAFIEMEWRLHPFIHAFFAIPDGIQIRRLHVIKPRKTGQTVASLLSRLQKMYAAYTQGRIEGDSMRYLVP